MRKKWNLCLKGKRCLMLGLALALSALFLCFLSLKDVPHEIRQSFSATGVNRLPENQKTPQGTVLINEADAEELQQLPGIGETLASAIVEERIDHGPFYYPEDLLSVKGIGQSKLQKILPYLTFDEEGE